MCGAWCICVRVWCVWLCVFCGLEPVQVPICWLPVCPPAAAFLCRAAFPWKPTGSKVRRQRWAWMQHWLRQCLYMYVWVCVCGQRVDAYWLQTASIVCVLHHLFFSVFKICIKLHSKSIQVCTYTVQSVSLPWQCSLFNRQQLLWHVWAFLSVHHSVPIRHCLPALSLWSAHAERPSAYRPIYLREPRQGFYKAWAGTQRGLN